VISGPVRDQAHLHGLMERIQELGIELVSVNPLRALHRPDGFPDGTSKGPQT
jgi:hypothetical protein